jgi:hypothetical protein
VLILRCSSDWQLQVYGSTEDQFDLKQYRRQQFIISVELYDDLLFAFPARKSVLMSLFLTHADSYGMRLKTWAALHRTTDRCHS